MYTWTEEKNHGNKRDHGFYLSEIIGVFNDPNLMEFYDAVHSIYEDRFITLGNLEGRVLFVVTADDDDGNTRLISARKAEPFEQRIYYEHYKQRTLG